MEANRRAGLVAGLVALVTLASLGASALAAAGQPSSASVRTLVLRTGDQVSIKGSPLACVVQNSSGTINLVCVEGTLSAPKPNSYATGIADKAASLNLISADGNSQKIVKLVRQPAIAGARFAVPARSARSYPIAPTAALLVGGTHIFCAVQRTDGFINVTCGLSSLAAKLQYPTGSYLVVASARIAALARKQAHGVIKTVAGKTQP